MLHVVVLTHGPDTCAAAHEEYGKMARESMNLRDEMSKKHGVTLQGAWVDAPAHTIYLLADAPNAHVVNSLMADLKYYLWNTVDIHPVVTLEEAMKLVK